MKITIPSVKVTLPSIMGTDIPQGTWFLASLSHQRKKELYLVKYYTEFISKEYPIVQFSNDFTIPVGWPLDKEFHEYEPVEVEIIVRKK